VTSWPLGSVGAKQRSRSCNRARRSRDASYRLMRGPAGSPVDLAPLLELVMRDWRAPMLVGSERALAKAVRTPGAGRRYTALTEQLQQGRARTVAAVSRPWEDQLREVSVQPEEQIRDRVGPAGRSG
jgi:hypothetical protein